MRGMRGNALNLKKINQYIQFQLFLKDTKKNIILKKKKKKIQIQFPAVPPPPCLRHYNNCPWKTGK